MKIAQTIAAITLSFLFTAAAAADDLIAVRSPHGAEATMDRLEALVRAQVWLGYNNPAWIAKRHRAAKCPVVASLTKALSGLAAATVAP